MASAKVHQDCLGFFNVILIANAKHHIDTACFSDVHIRYYISPMSLDEKRVVLIALEQADVHTNDSEGMAARSGGCVKTPLIC